MKVHQINVQYFYSLIAELGLQSGASVLSTPSNGELSLLFSYFSYLSATFIRFISSSCALLRSSISWNFCQLFVYSELRTTQNCYRTPHVLARRSLIWLVTIPVRATTGIYGMLPGKNCYKPIHCVEIAFLLDEADPRASSILPLSTATTGTRQKKLEKV